MASETIETIETIADIVAEIRAYGAQPPPRLMWLEIADRLEAAWKREKADAESDALAVGGIVEAARTTEKSSAVGNAAAMREAFKKIDDEMSFCDRNVELGIGFALEGLREHCRIVREILKSALALPPRQCDVDTPYEQANRMRQFCAKQKRNGITNCGYCPIKHQYQRDCTLAWAQMPYAEEGGAEQVYAQVARRPSRIPTRLRPRAGD